MIPVRLTLLLIGILVLIFLALGNPQMVSLNFIFWSVDFELYKVLFGSTALGVVLALLYSSQVRYLKRIRSRDAGAGRFQSRK